jgi:TRAP-type C4-dicarboxylate transport system permease small subunit
LHKLRRLLVSVDDAVYAVERIVLLISMLMMIALVFADVVQRTFSRPVGKTAAMMVWLGNRFGELSKETVATIEGSVADGLFAIIALGFCVAGVQSARNFTLRHQGDDAARAPFPLSIGIGAGVFIAGWGVIELMLVLAPQGIPGAQKFALGFFVWSGFIGASLAVRAKRHILLDAVKKKLSADVAPIYSFLGAFLTAAFCGFIAYMGFVKVFTEIGEWQESDHVIHVYEALPIPTWIVTLAIPLFLGIGALRFLAAGLSDLLYGPPLHAGADEHGIDFAELERQQAEEQATAEAPTGFIIGRPHGGREGGAS